MQSATRRLDVMMQCTYSNRGQFLYTPLPRSLSDAVLLILAQKSAIK
jgi:hypothetical protein